MAAAPKLLLVYTENVELNRVQQNTAEAFRHLASSVGAQGGTVVVVQFTATDPGAGTPLPVVFGIPAGSTPIGVDVIRSQNLTTPTAIAYEAVDVSSWTQIGNAISLTYVTGLVYGAIYRLTLRVTYA